MSARVVEFFFSPGSRYSYLAASQMPGLERDTGCRVEWRPVSGTAIRVHRGRDPFAGEPVSGQYDGDYRTVDALAWADYYRIPFVELRSHDVDFELWVRAAAAAKRLGKAAEYAWRLASAVYGSDTWPVDADSCVEIAGEIGLDRDVFGRALDSEEIAVALKETAAEAHGRGAFGVPTFFLGEQMFWGNDRLPLLRHALAAVST